MVYYRASAGSFSAGGISSIAASSSGILSFCWPFLLRHNIIPMIASSITMIGMKQPENISNELTVKSMCR